MFHFSINWGEVMGDLIQEIWYESRNGMHCMKFIHGGRR